MKKIRKNAVSNNFVEKAVVLAIVAVFIGSAFVPAVGSQVESILATQSSENEDVKIGNEEIVQLTKNKLNNLEDGSFLWDKFVQMFNRFLDTVGINHIIKGLPCFFTNKDTDHKFNPNNVNTKTDDEDVYYEDSIYDNSFYTKNSKNDLNQYRNLPTERDYNDVIFNSSFEMGNLKNVTYYSGDASGNRYYTAELNYSNTTFSDKFWWFHFNIENTTGKTITIELKNLSPGDFGIGGGLPRWQSTEPVYSYDYNNWSRVPLENISWNSIELNFSITIKPIQDKIWFAPIPPYTVDMRDDLFDTYTGSPYLNVSSLGITPLGKNLTVAIITDTNVDDADKNRGYIIAQQHSGETASSYVSEGLIHFLLNNTNPVSDSLRRNCVFKIIPVVNVEGVYYGVSRYTPFRGGVQYDLNRQWDLSIDAMQPEINWTFSDIQSWNPDVFMDLHTHSTTEDCFFYKGGSDVSVYALMDNVSNYWPETDTSRYTTTKSAGQVYDRLGVYASVIMEHPHDNRTSTVKHPTDHNPQTIDDWKNWGRGIGLGLFDYFNIGDLLVDSDFNESVNSSDFRFNDSDQDWYESRNDDPTLLTLNVTNVGGNNGKKASLKGFDTSDTAYLSQEFRTCQSSGLNVSFDVYIDKINSYFNIVENQYYNRTGFIYIGDDSGGTSGPCSTSTERFVYLTFFDSTPGDSGDDLEIRARETSSQSWHRTHEWSQLGSSLSYDTWYTVRLEVDFSNGIYSVYVDDVLFGAGVSGYSGYVSGSLEHISFSVGGTARGEFYVDNVSASKMLFNCAPGISDEFPMNESSGVSISTSLLSVNVTDVDGDLLNYTIETSPDAGFQDNSSGPGEVGGVKTCGISGLVYDTRYHWFVNASDGNSWNNVSFWFDTESEPSATQLVDSEFSDSVNSSDLRFNSSSQDWYESRNQNQSLLILDTGDVGGNTGKKAGVIGDDNPDFVYLTQEFSSVQTGLFNVSFDVFIERISDRDAYDRTCHVYLGDDSGGTSGPCSTGVERFLLLAFFDSSPGVSGDDLEIRARESVSQSWSNTSTWTQIATDLSYDTWYIIRLEVNVSGGTFDVFVDDVLVGNDIGGYDEYVSSSVKHISFYGGGAARGDFYLDNVFAPAVVRYTLDVDVVGNGSVVLDSYESTYGSGSVVELSAVADMGWIFSHWMGDLSGSDNPESITMDEDKSVVAVFSSMLLVDSEFNLSVNSSDLRFNSSGQDWYESRNYNQDLLTLDTSVVGSDTGKKAAIKGYDLSDFVYLTQEFSSAQTGLFNVSFDIYIDKISDRTNYDRTCHVYLGDDSGGTSGPCSTGVERFLFLSFFDSSPGDSGDDIEFRARESVGQSWSNTSTWTQIATGLSYDTWYTIRIDVNVSGGTYDVFVDDVLVGDDVSYYDEYVSSSVKHISFYGGGAARGDFYLDNVFAPAVDRHKLDISIVGGGLVVADPGESSYDNGTIVELTAVADPGRRFSHWSGDITGSNITEILLMDEDKSIIAHFEFGVLVDSEFNDSMNSSDLRFNDSGQDWYESRGNYPDLLILDIVDIDGNRGKKAGIEGRDCTNFVYLTQEFSSPQYNIFNVSLDIYIDVMSMYYDVGLNRFYNRTGMIYMGDDSGGTSGPCSTSTERFVFLAFYDSTPGDSGDDLELRARENVSQSWYRTYEWTTVATNLSYDTWYNLRVEVNFTGGTYDIYIDDVLVKENISGYGSYLSSSVQHISFYGGGTGRGNFFVDNVFSPATDRYTLDLDVVGNGSVEINPGEATYANGTIVVLNATSDIGWTFDYWSGDISGSDNPTNVTMMDDINITAVFTQDEYTLTVNIDGNGSVSINPDKSTYLYGDVVELNASGDSGWVFTHWSGDLTGSINPKNITMTENKIVTAYFSQDAIYTLTVNIVGEGYVSVDPDWALYLDGTVVELNASGDLGWSFVNWSGDLSGSTNPTNITMTDNRTITATFNSSLPVVQTMNATDITNTTANLWGNLISDGGENCSVWFEWGNVVGEFEECMGTIATGSVCKDGRSIVHKNRHLYVVNQKPYFYQGTNYSYFGVGTEQGMCRMGQNEKGLAMVNMDVSGTITNWEYQSDGQASNASYDDSDFHIPLGNYSTVYDAAMYIALHGNYGGGGKSGQYLIISSEPGVGAIVAIDSVLHTNITWINNTYAGCSAGKWYCDGQTGGYATRAKEIMDDIVNGNNSSDGDNLLNWKDIVQRVAKDTSNKEQGDGTFYIGGEISNGACRAATVHVAGNSSLNSSIHMSWLSVGETPQIGIFLPIYAGNLHSTDDIPSNFTDDNGGDGIHPYVNVKRGYASEGLPTNYYYCDRVREIQEYAFFNENITFSKFDDVMETMMYAEDEDAARSILAEYVNDTLPTALYGYINNLTFYVTNKQYPQISGLFNETIMGLDPGTVYYYRTWANNSLGTSNGSRVLFMTEPDIPTNVQVFTYNESQINLTWTKGIGAQYTIIERNQSGVTSWNQGEGIELYNGTGIRYEDTGVAPNTRYYYQLWSYATSYELHQYSSNYTSIFTGRSPSLLVDSQFNESSNSSDLRANSTSQDWYESRNDDPTLLTLDLTNISGNTGKKAALKNYGISSNAYLTQEFMYTQYDTFNVSLDIYIDKIADDADYDRTGFMFIGDDNLGTNGPCSTSDERFAFLTFYDSTPGDTGNDLEIRARENGSTQPWAITSTWIQVATNLSYDTWYTLRIELDVVSGTYDVYVDNMLKRENISKYDGYTPSSVQHISFSVGDRAKGEFYLDNVFSPALPPNKSPTIASEVPSNESTYVSISVSQLSVSITDRDGDLFNYTIETNPDVGNSSGINEYNGTKVCNISELTYNETYTWFVNATDIGSNLWTNKTFTFTTEPLPGAWWNNRWLFRKRISINHSKVTVNLTNFPVLIKTTDTHLANKAQANGDDIVFADYYGKQLSHEIEYYNGISGDLICWVNITNLRSMEETTLYMYYGNPSCNSQENPEGVWDSNFLQVLHLSETSGIHYDSTAYDNDASPENVTSDYIGRIGGGVWFPGLDNNALYTPDDGSTDVNDYLTISCWMYAEDLGFTGENWYTGPDKDGSWQTAFAKSGGVWKLGFWNDDGSDREAFGATTVNEDSWYYCTWVLKEDEGKCLIYLNGQNDSSDEDMSNPVGDGDDLGHGTWNYASSGGGQPWYGVMDEIRLYHGVLSDAWIGTSYNTMNSPDTFFSVGSEEIGVPPEEPLILNEVPGNGSEGVSVSLSNLSFDLIDMQGDLMDYSVITSPDIGFGSMNGVGNGTYTVDVSGLAYDGLYMWYVNATDPLGSSNWTNITYIFTTEANDPPVLSGENPSNGSSDLSINTAVLSVIISDPEGDSFNWSIETNPNIGSNNSDNDGNGVKSCNISSLSYGMMYTWFVNVSDSGSKEWTNMTFTFTTASNIPEISNVKPANGATSIEFNPVLQADIRDLQGDMVNWWIYSNISGIWSSLNNGTLTDGNGTISATTTNMNQAGSTYYWSVNITDPADSGEWVNETYMFTTFIAPEELSFAAFSDTHIGSLWQYPQWGNAENLDLLGQDVTNITGFCKFAVNLGDIINHNTAQVHGVGLPANVDQYKNNMKAYHVSHLNLPFHVIIGNHDVNDYELNDDDPHNLTKSIRDELSMNSPVFAMMRDGVLFLSIPELGYVPWTHPVEYEWVEYMTSLYPNTTTIIFSHQAIRDTTSGGSGDYRGKADMDFWSSLLRNNSQIKMWIHGHNHRLSWYLSDQSTGATHPVYDFGHTIAFSGPYSQTDFGTYHEEDRIVIYNISENGITTKAWDHNGDVGQWISEYDHTFTVETTYDPDVEDWYSFPVFLQDNETQLFDMKVLSPDIEIQLVGTQPMELGYDPMMESPDGWANEIMLAFGNDRDGNVEWTNPGMKVFGPKMITFPEKYPHSANHEDGRSGQPYQWVQMGTISAAIPGQTYNFTMKAKSTSGNGNIRLVTSCSDWGARSQYSTLAGSTFEVFNHTFGSSYETYSGIYTVPDDNNAWFLQGNLEFINDTTYDVSLFSVKRERLTDTTDDFSLYASGSWYNNSGILNRFNMVNYSIDPRYLSDDDGVMNFTAFIDGNHYGMARVIYHEPILLSRNARFRVNNITDVYNITLTKRISRNSTTFKMFPFDYNYYNLDIKASDASGVKHTEANGRTWVSCNTPSSELEVEVIYGYFSPVISNEYPPNGAVDVSLNPTLQTDVRDLQGDSVNWWIRTNASGIWSNLNNGTLYTGSDTIYTSTSNMSLYNTMYYWSVNVTDPSGSRGWMNRTYHFITRPDNYSPSVISPSPEDGAIDVPLSTKLSVYVSDSDGDLMNVSFKTNATGLWAEIGTNTSVGNGTYQQSYHFNDYNTRYWWSVNVTDSSGKWTNKTFSFTTIPSLSSWSYRRKIIIDHNNVVDDLLNFPLLIEFDNDADLANYTQDDFDDVLFTNATVNWSTGFASDRLNHEIETYNSTEGDLTVWVNIPYISSTQDTIIYMYYGTLSCGNMQNVEGTWHSNYMMVQHLNETSGTHYDSTNNSNDGTNFGSTQDSVGKVDGANSFDGTDDYVRVPNDPTLQFNEGSFTVEIWVKPATGTDNVRIINDRGTGGGGSYKGWQLKISASAGKWKFKDTGIDDATGNYKTYEGSTTYTYDEWHHIAMVYDADNELRCYVNGDLDGTLSVGSYGNITNSLPTAIGAAIASNGVEGTKSQFFNGGVDEVRLSNIVRNASWIKACYLNQHDPSSFYSFASPYPGPNVTVVSPADNISVENSVDFSFTPEFYAPIDGSEQAELWFNTTVVNNGSVFYSDSCRPQRGVIKNGKLYELEGGKITIRDFPNGTILRQGSTFGATHSNTAPVIVDDVVYGLNINGGLQAYNETSGTVVWTTSVGPGGSYSTTANSMELYDNHLYLQSKDHVIHKINITDGSETDNMTLDSGSTLKAHMLVDYQHDRLYALGNSRYYCIDLLSFSEIWNISFVANGGGSTRGGPVLVNDSNSEQYLTIITTFPQTYTYAVDFNGSIVWTWTTKTVRALATYNPNTGLIYLTDATGYTDAGYNLPVPGNIYAVYVKNGTTKWVTHGTGGNDRFSRPTTTSGDYLVWKTDNSGMNDYLYVANATTGEILAKVTAGDDRGYWCYPPALSGGYVATGGGYMHNGATPTLDIYHIGDGDWVDYYPLHANVNHTGYVENGLTSLGFINETWSCRKINETPLVNNSVNTIDFDFSSYNLPFNFTWNIHVIQSDDQDVWGDSRNVRVLPANMSPSVSSPSPVNNAVNVPTDLTQISIDISDPESDLFNWTIETSPDIGSSSSILDSDGVKTCSISGLDYNTTYTWFVNTSDVGSNGWTNRTYSFTTESPPGAWWNIGWGYRKSIVIDHNEVSGNLSYFPVLIDITDSNLSTKAQPDGDDFVFTDYNGNQLNHEIEYYDNSTGHLVVWVNVTSLSSMQDTVLYMYYGNLSCGNQQNIPGVWRSEFVMVQHLNETSGLHYDSTSYGNNGTAQSSVDQDATGQIDGADEFDDTVNAFIDVGIDSSMDIYGSNNDFSIWLWVKRDNIENLDGFFTSGSSGPNGIFFGAKSADENDLRFMSPGNTVTVDSTGDVIGDTGWHLVVLTADRDGVMRFWVDGVSVTSSDISGHAGENWNRVDDTYKVGTDRSEGNPMDGLLDEICVYNGVLSVDWVVTGFINQNDTSGFYSAGSEETLSDIIPPEISDVQATPPSTSQGGYVNITCDVTDNVDVDTVKVDITYPDSSSVNVTMNEGSYYYNNTYTIVGTYTYFIWANDTSGNSNMSSVENFTVIPLFAWDANLNFTEPGGTNDNVIFGEDSNASDGQDIYDVPKTGSPPTPYLLAWFDAGLSGPYSKLWEDYRFYPDTYKVWNLSVKWAPVSASFTDVTITWNSTDLSACEYSSVLLCDVFADVYIDMLTDSYYTYNASADVIYDFQIICSMKTHITDLKEDWNIVSLPFNQTVNKEDIIVTYDGSDYNWTQATTNDNPTGGPILLSFVYDWDRTNQSYGFTDTLHPGFGYWMLAYYNCSLGVEGVSGVDDEYITDLSVDWNIVGLPVDESLSKEDIIVTYDGSDYNWTQATTNDNPTGGPILLSFVYDWDRTNQSYGFTDTLHPGFGYWMLAYYNCTLKRKVV